jgi:hypothetical protein
MTGAHEHSTKLVVVSYPRSDEWEVWNLRFNRGRKLNKPVKFFASRQWKKGAAGAPYAGTHWDFQSERDAEVWFADGVAEYGGVVHAAAPPLLAKVKELGFVAR